ncbi:ATP-binding protein [Nocardioides convexus]|uniref:sensor histidine kinase n=1 Tax=Nocardioides convexus TaxID=2712224 RepID=UPI0024189D91|nr:ATP-binding protein [Nocardioides convexus]
MEDLLEVARLESGAEEVALTRTPLSALVPSAAVLRDADVLADPRRVERIVTNLVANAERHGGGEVSVTIEGPRLVVRDRGRGFPPEILERGAIRFHSTGRGSGLGLTIVQGQARALGASVEPAQPARRRRRGEHHLQEPGPISGSTGSVVLRVISCSGSMPSGSVPVTLMVRLCRRSPRPRRPRGRSP